MSKVLLFTIAILLCCALEAEGLTCERCKRFKMGFGCVSKNPSTCVARPGQKCKIVKSFLDGVIRGILTQGCTKPTEVCGATVFDKTVGTVTTTCCDNSDLCNKL